MKYNVKVRDCDDNGIWKPWNYVGGDPCDTYEEAEALIKLNVQNWAALGDDRESEYKIIKCDE